MTNASKRARELFEAHIKKGCVVASHFEEHIAEALTAAASEARAAERERLGFGKIVMMSEQRNRPGQPPRWCALARGSKVAVMGDTEEEARGRALATPAEA